MKFKKSLLLFATPLLATPFMAASCGGNNSDSNELKFCWVGPIDKDKKAEAQAFEKYINDGLKEKNINKTIKLISGSDKESENVIAVKTHKVDIAIPAISKYYQAYKTQKDFAYVFARTQAMAFKGSSTSDAIYKDGSDKDFLITAASEEQKVFDSKGGYENWKDADMGWNGSAYIGVYEKPVKYVGWQRGAIWMLGTDSEIATIKKAWVDKDLATFRSFGIMHGSIDSGSKYLLPEALMKKHFGAQFTTLAEEITNHTSNYIEEKAKKLGQQDNFKIAFDNECGYAWTHNGKTSYVLNKSNKKAGRKMQLLTLTDPIPYNVLIANKDVDKTVTAAIGEILAALTSANKANDLGTSGGFVAYEKVDQDGQQKIIDMFTNAGLN